MIKIRAFRAIDNNELCVRFINGHERVLEAVGVQKVTSSGNEWATNPASFVILVESEDEKKVLGGARLQVADSITPVPIETAAGYLDDKIYELVKHYRPRGIAEVCGLWNSMEVAGLGVGSIFLIRAALAISTQIGLDALLAFCSPFTTRIAGNYGFLKETSVGNNGTFYYPKLDLLATVVIQKYPNELLNASELETERIFDLRSKPIQVTEEKARKGKVVIDYDLKLKSVRFGEYQSKSSEI
jgi:hypothetical protein